MQQREETSLISSNKTGTFGPVKTTETKRKILMSIVVSIPLLMSFQSISPDYKNRLLSLQTELLEGQEFAMRGINGKGVKIAIIDAGFTGTDTHPGLAHLFQGHQILETWDFIGKNEQVYHGNSHGTSVLSCISGVYNNMPVGLAPEAGFLLARTEMNGEPLQEEKNWAAAVRWAVDHGADIIQSSIGYSYHRYFQEELDGKTSIAARAASEAARKGVLVINSVGNEGSTHWKTMGTPADADSIISVGAIDPYTALVASFSSLGPTADGRLKPNVCASGTVLAFTSDGRARTMTGTSFAAPLITGFAACLMQLLPNASNMEILQLIEKSGHLYPYFDYSHGYGVPRASYFFKKVKSDIGYSPEISRLGESFRVEPHVNPAYPETSPWKSCLYYQIMDSTKRIKFYGVASANLYTYTYLPAKDLRDGDILRIWLNGKTTEWKE
ncbi:MAG: hypothetical protein A2X22_13520 [Bacteroidetes bacterium GWF2_49_14]|nr:MAG: hypothetical protein A2X22_13520 [Bacteroidetes bacterium GWF2_49_14]HBB93328.1 hypothetical protein [Bacteroidales bacterium]